MNIAQASSLRGIINEMNEYENKNIIDIQIIQVNGFLQCSLHTIRSDFILFFVNSVCLVSE